MESRNAVSGTGSTLGGRYRLVAPLASGGMGTVWRAYDDVLDRPVAVKEVLLPPGLDDEARQTLRRRTLREARVAARLRHPAIVTVYDVVEQDDRPWIVMELVPSRSLDEAVRTRGPMPPAEVAAIGLRILDALVTAQAAGVQHRDIKPANVLLADDGRVVLTDFGIARHVGDETLTSAGLLVGSPNYLAPERARGLDSPGLQSDLWSLGATLYAAVEGNPPFERNGPLPTLAAVVMDEPPPPQRAGPLRPVIDALLVKNPQRRLDADETRAMLQQVLRGQRAGPPPPRRPPPTPPLEATRELPVTPPSPPAGTAAAAGEIPGQDRRAAADGGTPDSGNAAAARQAAAAAAAAGAETAGAGTAGAGTAGAGTAGAGTGGAAATTAGGDDRTAPAARVQPSAGAAGATAAPGGPPGAPPGTAKPPAREQPSPHPLRRRARLAAAVISLAALAGLAAVLIPLTTRGSDNQGQGQAAPSASASASPTAPATTQSAATGSPSARPPSTASSNPKPAPVAPGIPAGFTRYTDPRTGFSVVVPAGWRPGPGRTGAQVDFTDPTSGRFLRIETSDTPQPDPYTNWVYYERVFRQGKSDYRNLGIRQVDYGATKGWSTADWEFILGDTHVLDRNILVSPRRAHALYWSTPQALWNTADSRRIFEVAAASFHPAPVG